MPTLNTCGPVGKRVEFTYKGNTKDGITLLFDSVEFEINSKLISDLLDNFRGKTVYGGFSMDKPTPGGVGEFLQEQGNGLSPRHASFLCSVLQNEGLVSCSLDGNAVVVRFYE